jgi:hypothetical protein
MKTLMNKVLCIIQILTIGCFVVACSTSTYRNGDVYNPQTQSVDSYRYSSYYQLITEIVPNQLEVSIVTHLNKKTIPGSYTLKKYTHRLLPNDFMAQSDVMLYLNNISNEAITLELISISIEHKRLPYSARSLTIPANESISWHLGQVDIDLRLVSLKTRIEYIADEHMEKEYYMERNKKLKNDSKGNDEKEEMIYPEG